MRFSDFPVCVASNLYPRNIAAPTRFVLPITSSAAEAISSAMAISVEVKIDPWSSVNPL